MTIHHESRDIHRRVATIEAAADLKGVLGPTGDEQMQPWVSLHPPKIEIVVMLSDDVSGEWLNGCHVDLLEPLDASLWRVRE